MVTRRPIRSQGRYLRSDDVNSGHTLVRALDDAGLSPRLAMWVHSTDTDTWKLWVVPPEGVNDKQEFYRRIAEIITKHRADLETFLRAT
jgi:hypothetical protein